MAAESLISTTEDFELPTMIELGSWCGPNVIGGSGSIPTEFWPKEYAIALLPIVTGGLFSAVVCSWRTTESKIAAGVFLGAPTGVFVRSAASPVGRPGFCSRPALFVGSD